MKQKNNWKWKIKIFSKIIIIHINMDIINIINKMNIILPGLYRPIANLNDPIDGLIQITGENDNKENYFDIKNSPKIISEKDLISEYIYFGPGKEPTEKEKRKNKKLNKNLGNFNEMSIQKIPELIQPTEEKIINTANTSNTSTTTNQTQPTQTNQTNQQDNLFNLILNKIRNGSKLNNTIKVKLEIDVDYDINKIIELSKLLDVDKNKILSSLINIDWNNININSEETKIIQENKIIEEIIPPTIVEKNVDPNLLAALEKIENIHSTIKNNKNER